MGKYIIGITGASGSIYADHLIRKLLNNGHQVFVTITEAGKKVLQYEIDLDISSLQIEEEIEEHLKDFFSIEKNSDLLRYYDINRIGAPIASGSFRTDGMIVIPCSMGTVSSIACGASKNLLERAADVTLKERKPLIVVPRESPFNAIHLKNLLLLAQSNVQVIPAAPPFYNNPRTIDELVDFFVERIMDQLGIGSNFIQRWPGIY